MAEYKQKHANQLRLGARLRQLGVIVPMVATLSMSNVSCTNHKTENKKQEYGLLAYDSIQDHDLYGHRVTLKHVSINLYKDQKMTYTGISQMRWGTPKEDLPQVYSGEKTFAKKVCLGDKNDWSYIEVFENQYGVLISKDQPCFIVDSKDNLIYLGDKNTYLGNLSRYIHEHPIKKEENIKNKTTSQTLNPQENFTIDDILKNQEDISVDSVNSGIKPDSLSNITDSIKEENINLIVDTLLQNETMRKE